MIEHAKFAYCPLGKTFEEQKQLKIREKNKKAHQAVIKI